MTNRIWNISTFETFRYAAASLRTGSEDKAMDHFKQAPKEARNHVYGHLYSLLPSRSSIYNYGELAFHNLNGLVTPCEQKAQAVEDYLVQIVVATKLQSPAARYLALHHIFEEIIELLNRSDPYAMTLFNKLPAHVKENVFGFLSSGTAEEKSIALQTYLVQSLVDLFIQNDPSAMQLFSQMTQSTKDGIFGELYTLMKPWKEDYWGCAQDAFLGQRGFSAAPEQKAIAVKNYLNRVVLKLQTLSPVFIMPEILPRLTASEPLIPPQELYGEQQEAEELFSTTAIGSRSVCSKKFLDGLTSHLEHGMIKVGDVLFRSVSGSTQEFSVQPVASTGSSSRREILLLDPNHSPLLAQHFVKVRQKLKKGMTTHDVLHTLGDYVRREIFPQNGLKEVMQLIENARKTHLTTTHRDSPKQKIPFIPIDKFIEKRLGECRHHTLVLSYLIDRLLREKDPLIRGTVQHIRGNISEGAHAWITFIPLKLDADPQKYHLDTSCNSVVLINFAIEQNRNALSEAYGEETISDMLKRTNNAARKNGQPIN